MSYPTMEQVEAASRFQLGNWTRFLPSPGLNAAGRDDFDDVLQHESTILNRIIVRFYDELGGWNPQLSKQVGWG